MEGHKTQETFSANEAPLEQGALKGIIIFACLVVALGGVMVGPISQSGIKGAREPGYVVLAVGMVVLALALLSRRMSPRGRLFLGACGAFAIAAAAVVGLIASSWLYFSQASQDVSSSGAAGETASQAFGYFTVAGLLTLIAISGVGTGAVLRSRFRRSRELMIVLAEHDERRPEMPAALRAAAYEVFAAEYKRTCEAVVCPAHTKHARATVTLEGSGNLRIRVECCCQTAAEAAIAAARNFLPSAEPTRVCDLCSAKFVGTNGGLFTTRQLATNPEFWRCYAKIFQDSTGSGISLDEESKTYIDAVNQVCASPTPWLLCPKCYETVDQGVTGDVFARIGKIYQANQAAAQFVRTATFPAAFAGDFSVCTIHGDVNRVIVSKDGDHPAALSLATSALAELRKQRT